MGEGGSGLRNHSLVVNILKPPRNPVEEARPSFRDLMVDLMEENVLKLPDDATAEARKLGGLLKAGFQLYRDLQGIYISLPQEDAS